MENYLAAATAATPTGELPTPEDYFRATRARLADPTAVMLRGRDAGQALGQHPQQTAAEIADRFAGLRALIGRGAAPARLLCAVTVPAVGHGFSGQGCFGYRPRISERTSGRARPRNSPGHR